MLTLTFLIDFHCFEPFTDSLYMSHNWLVFYYEQLLYIEIPFVFLRINLPLKKCRLEPSSDSSFSADLISPGSSFPSHSRLAPHLPSPSPPEADPYEFSDEASKDPKTLTTRQRPSRDDIMSGMSRSSPVGIKMEDDGRHSDGLGNLEGGLIVKEEPVNGETGQCKKDIDGRHMDLKNIDCNFSIRI